MAGMAGMAGMADAAIAADRGRQYLIDTNALCEPKRPRPDARFMAFARTVPEAAGFVSVITLGEVNKGVINLPTGRRRAELPAWLGQMRRLYRERTPDVDAEIALRWGGLTAQAKTQGRELKPADGLIAATALIRGLTVMTRNVADFRPTGVDVVNPWAEGIV
jgi:predicted nucleic acid-binding protein